ncbi:STAS domain-containing protein [Rubinisphaera margarita]|uniref:STAS domain-containing protein n=1 Tax=Rubinisphaera margarita TaxID=2909586 RepID=UPI001EE8164D|nr:STAS domain-containing protein [Rubinisphaera margarita]MCG6156670.1 STAS domain-containing protein [Rubinisphaera margarita]
MTQAEQSFELTQEGNVSILRLLPQLNNVQWGDIDSIGTEVLNAMATQKNPQVIIDLSQLSYMGSAMVALIVRVWKAAQARGGKISVVCPNDGVREVLKLASLDRVWPIVNTTEEARQALGLKGSAMPNSTGTTKSSGSAGWIVAGILLLICIGLAVFAFNPGIFGIRPEVIRVVEPVPESTSETSAAVEPRIRSVPEVPAPEMTSPAYGPADTVKLTTPPPVLTTEPAPAATSTLPEGNPFAPQ